nr:MAG TPA: Adenosylhomocysteinase [Caudoviricetes sp.]
MASYYTSGYTPPQGVTSADQVRAIQQQLTQAGYNVGNTGADGIWGKNTQAAYDAYLSSNGKVTATRPNSTPDWSSPVVGGTAGSYYSGGSFSIPSVPSYDIGAAYDRSAEQYKAALDAAYNSQKAGIDAQAKKLADQYNAVRSNAYTNARLNAIGNNEVMASLGLAGNMYKPPASGVSETSRVNQDIGMRNDINSATRQEQAERDNLALELLQAGYTRDVEYAKWMADMLIAKANAEQAAAQQAFENQMALAKMYASMYGGSSGGSSGGSGGGSRSSSKKTTTAMQTYASAKNYLETISKQGATRKDMSSEIAGMNLPQYQKDILNSYSKILSTGFTKPSMMVKNQTKK